MNSYYNLLWDFTVKAETATVRCRFDADSPAGALVRKIRQVGSREVGIRISCASFPSSVVPDPKILVLRPL
jgi:hypothetical protein